jgi:osmotically-inducible protein OsmY
MMASTTGSKESLQDRVIQELEWDPKVNSAEIAVDAKAGTVTLRGTVGSPREKHEAERAARRVFGVQSVNSELRVRLLDRFAREDAELRGGVLQALMLDRLVPATIDASVDAGAVTLRGTANWQYERAEAEYVAANVPGVVTVEDRVRLTSPTPFAAEVKHHIEKAFERNAKLHSAGLSVEAPNAGRITVEGAVGSWAEHDAAIAAAWASPGVTAVEDRISVVY